MHVGNLFYTEPGMRLAQAAGGRLARRQGVLLQLGRRGHRVRDQARPPAQRRAGDFVVLEGGFHGRTMGALSATPQEAKQAPFAPLVPGFEVVPRDDPGALRGRGGRRAPPP